MSDFIVSSPVVLSGILGRVHCAPTLPCTSPRSIRELPKVLGVHHHGNDHGCCLFFGGITLVGAGAAVSAWVAGEIRPTPPSDAPRAQSREGPNGFPQSASATIRCCAVREYLVFL